MKKDIIVTLYSLPQTVFTLKELSLLFPEISYTHLKNRFHYFSKVSKLKSIRNGVYAKANYNKYELVNKLYTPSYISLETVLQKEGIIFQVYETIFAVSYIKREVTVDAVSIFYRRMKSSILTNRLGIENKKTYWIASKERAFLDAVYLYKDYYFDNLKPLNWDKVHELVDLYQTRALRARIKTYYTNYKKYNA